MEWEQQIWTEMLHLEMFFMQTVEKRISSELAVRAIFHHPASCFWLGVCQPVLVLACSCLVSFDLACLTSLDNNSSTVWQSLRCVNQPWQQQFHCLTEFEVCQPALMNSVMGSFWLGLSNTVDCNYLMDIFSFFVCLFFLVCFLRFLSSCIDDEV